MGRRSAIEIEDISSNMERAEMVDEAAATVAVTGAIILEAKAKTEWRRSQIQGFCYKSETSGRHRHVVRDVSRKAESWIWSKQGSPADYDATHAEMMAEIEQVRADILATEINALMGAH